MGHEVYEPGCVVHPLLDFETGNVCVCTLHDKSLSVTSECSYSYSTTSNLPFTQKKSGAKTVPQRSHFGKRSVLWTRRWTLWGAILAPLFFLSVVVLFSHKIVTSNAIKSLKNLKKKCGVWLLLYIGMWTFLPCRVLINVSTPKQAGGLYFLVMSFTTIGLWPSTCSLSMYILSKKL